MVKACSMHKINNFKNLAKVLTTNLVGSLSLDLAEILHFP